MNLKNLEITKERIEHDIRTNLRQQRELQEQQTQLEVFYSKIQDKIYDAINQEA